MCPENIWVMYVFAKTSIKSKVKNGNNMKVKNGNKEHWDRTSYNPITQNAEEGGDPQVQSYPKLHNKILSQAIKKET